MNNENFCLILLKPSKSDIFCDNYCQESMDHSLLSDYPICKFKVACCSVSIYTHMGWYEIVFKGGYVPSIPYTFMWVGIELYSKVCIMNCFHLLSPIFYLLFESIPQIIYSRFT